MRFLEIIVTLVETEEETVYKRGGKKKENMDGKSERRKTRVRNESSGSATSRT